MSQLILVIGNKNYSSWSMRAGLALAQTGAAHDEVVIPLDRPDTAARIGEYSPSAKVPVLIDGAVAVWDSLAISEYLAERFAGAGLWPGDAAARALARAVCAEMHAGFQPLRAKMPMNIRASKPERGRTARAEPGVEADIARIVALWRDCRARFGAGGPFLFGAFTAADAFYAPVVSRFKTYAVPLEAEAQTYAEAVLAWPKVAAWCAAAAREPWTAPRYDDL